VYGKMKRNITLHFASNSTKAGQPCCLCLSWYCFIMFFTLVIQWATYLLSLRAVAKEILSSAFDCLSLTVNVDLICMNFTPSISVIVVCCACCHEAFCFSSRFHFRCSSFVWWPDRRMADKTVQTEARRLT